MFGDLYALSSETEHLRFMDQAVDIETLDLDGILGTVQELYDPTQKVEEPVVDEALLQQFNPKRLPPYLRDRGVDADTASVWEIAYHAANSRVVFPVRCRKGNLRGATARGISPEVRPKYLNYWDLRRGKWLYGEHLINGRAVIITEGPIDALMGYQHLRGADLLGEYSIIALMGSKLSRKQTNTLIRLSTECVLFMDRDASGREGVDQIQKSLRGKIITSSVSWGSRVEKDLASLSSTAFLEMLEAADYWR